MTSFSLDDEGEEDHTEMATHLALVCILGIFIPVFTIFFNQCYIPVFTKIAPLKVLHILI